MFLVVLVVHTTKLPLFGSSLCLLHIVGNRVLNHYILYPTTSCIYLYTLILYLVITISRTFTCSPTRDAVVQDIVVACMSTHYILGTISCTDILLYHYISYYDILYLSACSPLHLVFPISCGYDWVWYYISCTMITVVFRVSCNTVTTRFSPTRRHFSRVLQYIGKSVPPIAESFHLANSTICSNCNSYPTTISCGFSARVWPLCNMYKNRVKIPSIFV